MKIPVPNCMKGMTIKRGSMEFQLPSDDPPESKDPWPYKCRCNQPYGRLMFYKCPECGTPPTFKLEDLIR